MNRMAVDLMHSRFHEAEAAAGVIGKLRALPEQGGCPGGGSLGESEQPISGGKIGGRGVSRKELPRADFSDLGDFESADRPVGQRSESRPWLRNRLCAGKSGKGGAQEQPAHHGEAPGVQAASTVTRMVGAPPELIEAAWASASWPSLDWAHRFSASIVGKLTSEIR